MSLLLLFGISFFLLAAGIFFAGIAFLIEALFKPATIVNNRTAEMDEEEFEDLMTAIQHRITNDILKARRMGTPGR